MNYIPLPCKAQVVNLSNMKFNPRNIFRRLSYLYQVVTRKNAQAEQIYEYFYSQREII